MTGSDHTGATMHCDLGSVRRHARGAFLAVGLFSLAINLLLLTAPLYMLQVYDRVLSSRSVETLAYLTLMALFAFLAYAALDFLRGRVLGRVGRWLDQRLSGPILAECIAEAAHDRAASADAVREVGTLRAVIAGPPMQPLFDAPWTPIFLGVIFLLHPLLGWVALAGAGVLLVMALVNELVTRGPLDRASMVSARAQGDAEEAVRHSDAVHAMGMAANLVSRWCRRNGAALALQDRANARGGAISALSKLLRQGLQIGMLGLGAWLVLQNELSAGGIIAGSILMARALAPVDMAISSWRSIAAARRAYARIRDRLESAPERGRAMALPRPEGVLDVQGVTFVHPGADQPVLRRVSFKLLPGESLGVVGATAAGKTTLARILVGNLKPRAGHARLDGADLADWDAEDRGRYVGYLSQQVDLFSGTVRENIARMGEGDDDCVVRAARLACIHEMILKLPRGYDTEIGEGGAMLSGGQRQQIALARALYGEPALVVLDEPNASLDLVGEEALRHALESLQARGVTTVVVSHRPGVMKVMDKLLVLQGGKVRAFGPRDEILKSVTAPPRSRRVAG